MGDSALERANVHAANLAALEELQHMSDLCGYWSNQGPSIRGENDNRYFAVREILLVRDILVAAYQNIETGGFSRGEQ